MNFNADRISFNEEDRWITGLPESLPIDAVSAAFGITRRARSHCYGRFVELLTCDEALTDAQAASLQLFPDRLRRLDQLSEKFVPVLVPLMISEIEQGLPE